MHESIPRVFLAVGECGDDKGSALINALRDLNNEIEKGAKEKAAVKLAAAGEGEVSSRRSKLLEGRRGLQKVGLTVLIYNGYGRYHEFRTP